MTNIINLNTRTADFSNRNDDGMYFPVSMREFSVPHGENLHQMADASNFRAVVREDTGKVLAVHGKDYNLVTNEEIFPVIEDALRHSPELDVTDMYTKTSVVDEGGSVIKSYYFPAHSENIGRRVGDVVSLGLRFGNSYDGRWSLFGNLDINRLICTNGMVSSESFVRAFGRHTKNLDPNRVIQKTTGALDVYLSNVEVWNQWAGKSISQLQVTQMLDELDFKGDFNEVILAQFRKEVEEAGHRTVWELFNALTNWSTHHKMRKGANRGVNQLNREKRVHQVITSNAFLRLAA